MQRMLTIGIAGTAKNTGKTTTTSSVIEHLRNNPKISLGLTSIGYDGEDLDNVTGLPKPRIEVWPGVLVAAAEKCLEVSSAPIQVLEKTDLKTPLGKIILGKVTRGGKLVVAGPNKSNELQQIINRLRHHQSNIIMVDGALNRIAPMVQVDGLIIATGAARTPNLTNLAQETKSIVELLQYPVINQETYFSVGSVLNINAVKKLMHLLKEKERIFINGVMVEKCFNYLLEHCQDLKNKMLIFPDAIKLLVSGDIGSLYDTLKNLKDFGLEIGVKKSINVIAVTINPYYPTYRFISDDYEAAFVDADKLFAIIDQSIDVPVYDIVKQGGEKLYQDIMKFWTVAK